MTNQIDELMQLADDYATYAATAGIERYLGATPSGVADAAREALNQALEAALKPGDAFGYVNTNTGQFFKDVEDCRKNNAGHWRTVYTAPPVQTPKGLFVDLIAQHPGLAEELRAIDAAPPRLTMEEINSARAQAANTQSCVYRAIETAVRNQWAKHLGVNDE